jgi:membrane protease YdiL (CAAX protease family)
MAGASPRSGAAPYGWLGLGLSILPLVVLAILIWFGLALLVWAAEIPVEGRQRMLARLLEAGHAATTGDVGNYIQIPFGLVIGPLQPDIPAVENAILVVTMLLQVSLMAAVVAIARWHAGAGWRDLLAWHSWSLRRNALLFLVLLIATLGLNEAGGLITQYLAPGPSESVPPFGVTLVLSFLSNVVAAAYAEELIVRGWLYSALREKLAGWPTVLITSVIFALLHSISSVRDILETLPLALAAGYLRERTGSVRAPIAFHLLHNAIVFGILAA